MNPQVAFCPRCKNEVAFLTEGGHRRCPLCGFRFEIGHVSTGVPSAEQGIGLLGMIIRFFLVVLAVLAIGVGVIFIGCITSFKL